MKTLIFALSALLLTGCAGTNATRSDVALAIACDTYATALDQITPRKASLSAAVVSRINAANAAVRPACGKDAVMDPSTAVRIVDQGIALLNTVKGSL